MKHLHSFLLKDKWFDTSYDMIEDHKDEWDDEFEEILREFESTRNRKVLHTLLFY